MAILRTRARLLSSAPPPSPIATAKGSRSAAADEQVLSEYLSKTLKIPDLNLPESYFPVSVNRRIPVEIDFSSVTSRDDETIRQVLKSAMEFGAFRIIGRGISVEELDLIFEEAEWVFANSREEEEEEEDLDENLDSQKGGRESLFWFRSREEEMDENLDQEMVPERYRKFRRQMDDIYGRLEAITNTMGQIFAQNLKKVNMGRIQDTEPILCLHRNNLDRLLSSDGQDEKDFGVSDHAFNLYLTNKDQEFHVQSSRGLMSSNLRRGTILVIARKQLEDWSQGKFKCNSGEPIFERGIEDSPSYLIKFMCSPITLPQDPHQMSKTITIYDQIFILLAIFLLYSFLRYIL